MLVFFFFLLMFGVLVGIIVLEVCNFVFFGRFVDILLENLIVFVFFIFFIIVFEVV